MDYPFVHKEHRVYKNTTLHSVVVSFDFGKRGRDFFDEAFYDKLDAYMMQNFSLKVDHNLFDKGIRISNNKNGAVLMFFNGVLILSIDKSKYVSFEDSAMPQIHKLHEFVGQVLREQSLRGANIRKLNIWQLRDIKKGEEDKLIHDVMGHVFSDDLLSSSARKPLTEDEKGVLLDKFIWKEGTETVTVRLAFVKVKGIDNAYNLVLDLDLGIAPKDGLPLASLPGTLRERNGVLFDAYHWCVRDEIIKQMEEA